ncbi:MAG: hypothetical protein RLZZ522_944 [Verrucomicrobiota bacterium]
MIKRLLRGGAGGWWGRLALTSENFPKRRDFFRCGFFRRASPTQSARLAAIRSLGRLRVTAAAERGWVGRHHAAFPMSLEPLKDGIRSQVRIDFYGNVHKRLRGTAAAERYATEVAVLKELAQRGCPYVPRLLEEHPEECYFVSTNCGQPASQISKEKADRIFAKLERDYGIRHLDAEPRNITYSDKLGCFCVIDFELAEILPVPTSPAAEPPPP